MEAGGSVDGLASSYSVVTCRDLLDQRPLLPRYVFVPQKWKLIKAFTLKTRVLKCVSRLHHLYRYYSAEFFSKPIRVRQQPARFHHVAPHRCYRSPPIRPHDAGTPSPYDATAVAVGSQIMAAAGRLSAALGADGGESFLSGLTPPVAATCTPSYSPLLPGASSAGTGTGGGTSGSKGMTSSKSAFELTQPDFGFFSMAQRSLSDGRTGAVASGNGIVYGSDDFSTQASGQPKPSLTSCRREDNRSRSA